MEDKYIRYAQIAVAIAVVVGAISTYLISYFSDKRDERKEREKALSATITNKDSSQDYKFPFSPPPLNFDAAIIVLGTNLFRCPKSEIKNGYNPFKWFPYEEGTIDIPLEIKIIDKKLVVSATVFDKVGKIICQIDDNQWLINDKNFLKRNYDDNGLEVIDQEGNVVLSVDLVQPYVVEVNGVFYSPTQNVVVFASIKDGLQISKTDSAAIKRREKALGKTWKQIYYERAKMVEKRFVYTGVGFLGKRVAKQQ